MNNDKMREALHRISLCSQNSMSSKEECGRIAREALAEQHAQGEMIPQYRKRRCADWYDGYADHEDGRGPYEERILYAVPPAQHAVLTTAPAVPPGWKLVPMEPTPEMIDAIRNGYGWKAAYSALLAAAPEVKP